MHARMYAYTFAHTLIERVNDVQGVIASKEHARSMAGLQGARSYEDERGMLGVGHSPITKSLSTPSIPAATQGKAGGKCLCITHQTK